jgi:hypothetical protein
MIRTADDLVQSILADSRPSGTAQVKVKNIDDLVAAVPDELAETSEPQPTSSEASLTSRRNP